MRLRNAGQAMVLSPKPPPCLDIRADEENRNGLSQAEDNNRLSSEQTGPCRAPYTASFTRSNSLTCGNLNNNDNPVQNDRQRLTSESASVSSRDESLGEYEGQSSSSIDIYPQGDEYQCFSTEDATDSDFSDDGNCGKEESEEVVSGGIVNVNYPGFSDVLQDLTAQDDADTNGNNENFLDTSGRDTDRVNHLDHHFQKDFYDKPKFLGCAEIVQDLNIVVEASEVAELNVVTGAADAGCDNVFPEINFVISSAEHKFEFSPKETYQDSPEEGIEAQAPKETLLDSPKEAQELYLDSGVFDGDGDLNCFEASFFVQTALLPVSGIFETAVLPEDDSDVTPSPSEESKALPAAKKANISEAKTVENSGSHNKMDVLVPVSVDLEVSKLAKDSANEKKMVEGEEKKREVLKGAGAGGGRADVTWRGKGESPWSFGKASPLREGGVALGRSSCRKGDGPVPDAVLRRAGAPKLRGHCASRRSVPSAKKASSDFGVFDVYNIETAMPNFDLAAIESHLKAAREEEQRRKNDREEIRRRLAMGPDSDDLLYGDRTERGARKPSLQTRLQGGMNLQICFMNDTGSDSESPGTDADGPDSSPPPVDFKRPSTLPLKSAQGSSSGGPRPSTARLTLPLKKDTDLRTEADLLACQARLQCEARQALLQAKDMARMQMEVERQRMVLSPITQMVRSSLLKVGVPFPEEKRRLSRQILTEMNVAQLQVIINDLHSQIEVLNENLVEYLMERDELHMGQDSMLVDIEDLTRYIGAKEKGQEPLSAPVSGNETARSMQMTLQKAA